MPPREVLMLPMRPNDAGAATVGGYLQALLLTLWDEEEGFSGKRPFGNSGWSSDLHEAIIAGGAGSESEASSVVAQAIEALFSEAPAKADADKIAAMLLRQEADRLDPPEDAA